MEGGGVRLAVAAAAACECSAAARVLARRCGPARMASERVMLALLVLAATSRKITLQRRTCFGFLRRSYCASVLSASAAATSLRSFPSFALPPETLYSFSAAAIRASDGETNTGGESTCWSIVVLKLKSPTSASTIPGGSVHEVAFESTLT